MRECTEELLPRTELTTHATIVLERIQTTGKPVVVMQAGNALAVVMEAEQYRQSQGNLALFGTSQHRSRGTAVSTFCRASGVGAIIC